MNQKARLTSLDALRGLVMIIMALDHTRDFFHGAAAQFNPEDLARTSPILFLTRWVTHFCAPVFAMSAGMGAYLWAAKGRTKGDLSDFLWKRGLWLVFLEFTFFHMAVNFKFDYSTVFLLVMWSLGWSMIFLAGLIHLPFRWLAALSVGVIALHNWTDGAALGPVWGFLHQPTPIPLGNRLVISAYPLIPWINVMALGYCLGPVMNFEDGRRRKWLFWLGVGTTAAFVLLRAVNVYGDPRPWDGASWMSFLRTNKYPPSLQYLLMTLGPAFLFLRAMDEVRLELPNPLIVFGRVPLFYFMAHFYLLHLVAFPLALLRYGYAGFVFGAAPAMGGDPKAYPAGYGYELVTVYLIWTGVVVALYPVCLWFARMKARRRDWWLSYL